MKWPVPKAGEVALHHPDAAVPDGLRVYAIGDIHGRADLLAAMAERIGSELRTRPAKDAVTICLGDYIDRGPESAAVIDRLARGDFPTRLVTLRGNHEDIMQRFLAGLLSPEQFYVNGGDATVESYGLDPEALLDLSPNEIEAVMGDALGPVHRDFLDATKLCHEIGDYFFCHAGVRPDRPLDQQRSHDLLWIREEFLLYRGDLGKTVIHGHTPVDCPWVRPNGIDVDTQAFASGVLTAIVLEGSTRRFLQAKVA